MFRDGGINVNVRYLIITSVDLFLNLKVSNIELKMIVSFF